MFFCHVWFSPKNRKAILDSEVGEAARQEFLEIARQHGFKLHECELGYDHVHMLIEISGGQTLPSVMHLLKGASAHRLFQRFPDLKIDLRHVRLWQRGYGYRRLETHDLPTVRRYIRNHRQVSEPRVFNPRG